jgi:hypothetical protein
LAKPGVSLSLGQQTVNWNLKGAYFAIDGVIPALVNNDGGVFTLDPNGTLTPFVTGLDATHVVFDTQGILGGGMFIADQDEALDGSKPNTIWRVTAIPEPNTFLLLSTGLVSLLAYNWRRKRQRSSV